MNTVTASTASHIERLKARGYTKSTALFSKRALSLLGDYMYFNPDTGMCI